MGSRDIRIAVIVTAALCFLGWQASQAVFESDTDSAASLRAIESELAKLRAAISGSSTFADATGHSVRGLVLPQKPAQSADDFKSSAGESWKPAGCVEQSDDWLLPEKCCDPWTPTFLAVASAHATDKIGGITDVNTAHNYDRMYQHVVAPIRCRSGIRLLEIGLGCGYQQEGGSLTIWLQYIPRAEVIVGVEFDTCVHSIPASWKSAPPEFAKTTPATWSTVSQKLRFEQADQANATRLREIGDKHGPFDIVIDDGGHTMRQQIVSLVTMWPFIRPGGLYVVEDLHSAYLGAGFTSDHPITTPVYLARLQEIVHHKSAADGMDDEKFPGARDIAATLHSMHCFREACALRKKSG